MTAIIIIAFVLVTMISRWVSKHWPGSLPSTGRASRVAMIGFTALVSIIMAAVIASIIVVLASPSPHSSSASLTYNSLDYHTRIEPNGDLRVTQRIDMRLRSRGSGKPWRQLYQQYTLNPNNLTGISDVSIRDLDHNIQYRQSDFVDPSTVGLDTDRWDGYSNQWYQRDAGVNANGRRLVEIGWNIPSVGSAEHRVFEVSMTMQGTGTLHPDVASIQWEPFGKDNQVPIRRVTGTIQWPRGITSDSSWFWQHYSGNGSSSRRPDGTAHFEAYDVRAGAYMDLVLMADAHGFHGVGRTSNQPAKNAIMADEDAQAKRWHDRHHDHARDVVITASVIAVLAAISCLAILLMTFRSASRSKYDDGVGYCREPPDMSPAAAACLNDVMNGGNGTGGDTALPATVLSLVSKHAMRLSDNRDHHYSSIAGKHDIGSLMWVDPLDASMIVEILPACGNDRSSLGLSESEESALRMFEAVSKRIGSSTFTLNQMKVASSMWKEGNQLLLDFHDAVRHEMDALNATRANKAHGLTPLLLVLAVIGTTWAVGQGQTALGLLIGAPIMACAIFSRIYGHPLVLTGDGLRIAGRLTAFKRYLTDFSDFDDRGVADLVLWDRYLVYATALGVSGETLRELVKAHPEITDEGWVNQHAGDSLTCLDLRSSDMLSTAGTGIDNPTASAFDRSFDSFGDTLTSSFTSLSSVIAAAAPTSSSGGSGGSSFGGSSGGSGGGSFGGR